ncbi:MAG: hypothetical protein Q7T55_07775 [Solirubrobacteraceae bacterium]|nr:hypothetical protein [Solirubrobacteraceae bacterium]
MTTATAERSERRVSRIVIAAGLIAVGTVAVGLYGRLANGKYGTVSAPFVMGWLPRVDPAGFLVALLGCAAVVILGRRIIGAGWSPPVVAVALYALTLAAGLALNVARDGIHGWYEIYDLAGGTAQGHAINEYLPGLPTLEDGIPNYLDRFAEVVPSQSVNVAGHPPGPLLLAHLLGVSTAQGLAALVIAIGSLCAPLTYRLGWTLSGDERTGRIAGVLCLASPLVLLFGVTSFDYAFAAFAAAAACGLVARRRRWQLFGLVALAVASLMSWALLAVGAWAVFVRWRRDGFRDAVRTGVLSGVAVGLLQGGLAARYGYDPIGTLRATEQVYRDSLARVRPYRFWVFGSPVAWGLMLGPLIVAAVIRAASARTAAGLAIVAVVLIAAIGGFTKAETERIWLYLVPLACAAAAPYVPVRRLTLVMVALVAQALVVQLLFNTVW